MSATIQRHEIRYNDWYSAHRPAGSKEAYGDNHIQYGTNPDGSTYEVRPWKDPDNPEFAKLNPEYARLLRQQRDQRMEEARLKDCMEKKAPISPCSSLAPLSPAAKEAIEMERHLQKIREGKIRGGSGGSISKWELLAQKQADDKSKAKASAAKKAAEDQAWLNDVRARTAAQNTREIEAGVMQERHEPDFTVRVRRLDGARVSDTTADQAQEAARVLLPFFRGELMSALLSKMPRGGSAPGGARAEVKAYRGLQNVAQATERGRDDRWQETHELKFSLNPGSIVVSYHSRHANLTAQQLEAAGQTEVAMALINLEMLGVSLHIEPR